MSFRLHNASEPDQTPGLGLQDHIGQRECIDLLIIVRGSLPSLVIQRPNRAETEPTWLILSCRILPDVSAEQS